MPLTRSMRIMFVALIVALAVGFGVLRSKNQALEAQLSTAKAVTP